MLQYENPYAGRGANWYKGNLHAHSTNSDGNLSPEDLCQVYRKAGYDFLVITDHNKVTDTSALSTSGFLTIPGAEIGQRPDHVLHIAASSAHPIAEMGELLRDLQAEPGLTIVAHPNWSNMSWERIAAVDGYAGIEIYTYSPDINRGRGYSVELWDMLLNSGRRVWGFATDDCHYRAQEERPNCCGGWVVVAADDLTQPAILSAIKRGAFYSSQGPSFYEIQTSPEGLYIRCSGVKVIRFLSQTPGAGWSFHSRVGERLNECFVSWDGKRPRLAPNYVRVEILDDSGHLAWSNPIYLGIQDEEQGAT